MTKRLIVFMILICGVMLINAQESTPEPEQTPEVTAEATESTDDICPMIVNNALDFTQSRCSETDTNEACYGYTFIQANLRSETAQFVQPGDIEEVINIQGLQLSPLDTISGEWGVVVLRVEPNANLLENQPFPEDDVQIVLYGDAQLSDDTQFVEVTATANVNIREFPRTTASIVGSLIANDPVVANGRLEDNSWYRVRIVEEGEVLNAWVSADF
ncbi:MAG: SH3 domain-containing protein, partial [Chloroflexota bacterium]